MELSCDDRLELHELYSRYAHAVDSGDVDGWCALFAKAPRLITSSGDEILGQAALRTFGELRASEAARGTSHHMTNFVFVATPDGVKGKSYFFALRVGPDGGLRFRALGRYEDDLVKEDGRWVIACREITPWANAGVSGAPFAFADVYES